MISFGYVVILFLIVEVVQALQSSGEERKNSSTYVLFSIQKKKKIRNCVLFHGLLLQKEDSYLFK